VSWHVNGGNKETNEKPVRKVNIAAEVRTGKPPEYMQTNLFRQVKVNHSGQNTFYYYFMHGINSYCNYDWRRLAEVGCGRGCAVQQSSCGQVPSRRAVAQMNTAVWVLPQIVPVWVRRHIEV
jgi:hypothetical protein